MTTQSGTVGTKQFLRQEVVCFADAGLHGVIQFPSALSEADYADFCDHLDLLKRKLGRTLVREVAPIPEAQQAGEG